MYKRQVCLVREIKHNSGSQCQTIIFSGGEPTIQLLDDLISYLKFENYKIHLETNGSRPLSNYALKEIDHITLSPKQELAKTRLQRCDDLKILYPWIHREIRPELFSGKYLRAKIYIQPLEVGGINSVVSKQNQSDAIDFLKSKGKYRLSCQLHKFLDLP